MKIKQWCSLLFSLVAIVAHAESIIVSKGVSCELALQRTAQLSNVTYNLTFYLTDKPTDMVKGEASISFSTSKKQDVVLDFRAAPDQLGEVRIDGVLVGDVIFANEHILLPKKLMTKGQHVVNIAFTAGNESLNRREEYLYTLFVPDRARTVFPCFDQPNIKAHFDLQLYLPHGWVAVSNGAVTEQRDGYVHFSKTEPLPTYLFAFAAGIFDKAELTEQGRTIVAYHRETDPDKIAQLPDILRITANALRWQETFTEMPYPFQKYDIVILPGFQFGGMEHTGASFYNDNTMFLPKSPTPQEQLKRAKLINHEVSHLWFGDAVTMKWFDEVWTKEVFANFFAAEMTAPLFTDINHSLNWLCTYVAPALAQDRTDGRTSITQELPNMRFAGLIYNNIIYNKAPVMMRKIVEMMGWEAFRRGIIRYVKTYCYGNATWDDLIEILDSETTADLRAFSQMWVYEKGMPTVALKMSDDGETILHEEIDPAGQGRRWPQSWRDTIIGGQIYPNVDGRGYGFFTLDDAQLHGLLSSWLDIEDATARQSLVSTLYENYCHNRLNDSEWLAALVRDLSDTLRLDNPLTAATMVGYISEPLLMLDAAEAKPYELSLLELSRSHPMPSVRRGLITLLAQAGRSDEVREAIWTLWRDASHPLLSEADYTTMAFELAVRMPEQRDTLLTTQLARITNSDRRKRFEMIAPATSALQEERDEVFRSLSLKENRRIEPWALTALYYLNHPLRQSEALRYIRPALELLPEIQQTGDIFFPASWCTTLLGGHRTRQAYNIVQQFIDDFKPTDEFPELLINKVRSAMGHKWHRQ
ncbi:MAG: M1 family aminopeptidase [Bacteroidales bacterium]|nr:M1 family aminopeptidase [Bacteroidales bacterium]